MAPKIPSEGATLGDLHVVRRITAFSAVGTLLGQASSVYDAAKRSDHMPPFVRKEIERAEALTAPMAASIIHSNFVQSADSFVDSQIDHASARGHELVSGELLQRSRTILEDKLVTPVNDQLKTLHEKLTPVPETGKKVLQDGSASLRKHLDEQVARARTAAISITDTLDTYVDSYLPESEASVADPQARDALIAQSDIDVAEAEEAAKEGAAVGVHFRGLSHKVSRRLRQKLEQTTLQLRDRTMPYQVNLLDYANALPAAAKVRATQAADLAASYLPTATATAAAPSTDAAPTPASPLRFAEHYATLLRSTIAPHAATARERAESAFARAYDIARAGRASAQAIAASKRPSESYQMYQRALNTAMRAGMADLTADRLEYLPAPLATAAASAPSVRSASRAELWAYALAQLQTARAAGTTKVTHLRSLPLADARAEIRGDASSTLAAAFSWFGAVRARLSRAAAAANAAANADEPVVNSESSDEEVDQESVSSPEHTFDIRGSASNNIPLLLDDSVLDESAHDVDDSEIPSYIDSSFDASDAE